MLSMAASNTISIRYGTQDNHCALFKQSNSRKIWNKICFILNARKAKTCIYILRISSSYKFLMKMFKQNLNFALFSATKRWFAFTRYCFTVIWPGDVCNLIIHLPPLLSNFDCFEWMWDIMCFVINTELKSSVPVWYDECIELNDLTIGWQNLNLLSHPTATLVPQARQARPSGETTHWVPSLTSW